MNSRLCVLLALVALAAAQTACTKKDDCKNNVGQYQYWTDGSKNFEGKDSENFDCCATYDGEDDGFCYDDKLQSCESVSGDPTNGGGSKDGDPEGKRAGNVICAHYEKACGSVCYNPFNSKCVSNSPFWDSPDFKEYQVVPDRMKDAGMRLVWVPMIGMLFTIALTVLTILLHKTDMLSSIPLLAICGAGIFFNLFSFLGDANSPEYGLSLTFGFVLILWTAAIKNDSFTAASLLVCVFIAANATGFWFSGNGLVGAAHGNGFNNGCSDQVLAQHNQIPTWLYSNRNPQINYGGLCSIGYLAFSFFVAVITIILFVIATVQMASVCYPAGGGGGSASPVAVGSSQPTNDSKEEA